jgi:vacuolar-type H+-ATPase subunit I/STV1
VKVIKAIYNFIVGDMVILIGVVLALAVLALVNNVAALAPIRSVSGLFLIIAVLASLVATLYREAFSLVR